MDEFFCYDCGAGWLSDSGNWVNACASCSSTQVGSKIQSHPIDLVLGVFESHGTFWMEACSARDSCMYTVQVPSNALIIPRGVVSKNKTSLIDFYTGEPLGQLWIQ